MHELRSCCREHLRTTVSYYAHNKLGKVTTKANEHQTEIVSPHNPPAETRLQEKIVQGMASPALATKNISGNRIHLVQGFYKC